MSISDGHTGEAVYPMLLEPVLHKRVWGGRKLETLFGKQLPSDEPYGESWEVHDTVSVANGALQGRTLADVLKQYGSEIIGEANDPTQGFPLLVKILDAEQWLSVQVHPDDKFAAELEGDPRGKTEAWYVLDAQANSRLVIGIEPSTPLDTVKTAIENNSLEDLLVYGDVERGDVLLINAGTIHAIGEGIVIYEVQQSSDVTYRLYDWGRMGLDGKPRELHIEKSLKVANLETLPTIEHEDSTSKAAVVISSEYFATLRHTLRDESLPLSTEGKYFHALTCIDGTLTIASDQGDVDFKVGQTVLIPAALGSYVLRGTGVALNSMQHSTAV
jgi:mannose-6-phosphate isomerase